MTVIHPSLMPCKTQAKAANELMKRVGRVGVSVTRSVKELFKGDGPVFWGFEHPLLKQSARAFDWTALYCLEAGNVCTGALTPSVCYV